MVEVDKASGSDILIGTFDHISLKHDHISLKHTAAWLPGRHA